MRMTFASLNRNVNNFVQSNIISDSELLDALDQIAEFEMAVYQRRNVAFSNHIIGRYSEFFREDLVDTLPDNQRITLNQSTINRFNDYQRGYNLLAPYNHLFEIHPDEPIRGYTVRPITQGT